MALYTRTVHYYETDRMGITHHANYVRWMEEARVHFLASIGWPYEALEAQGIHSPVVAVTCRYHRSTTFADEVQITTTVAALTPAKLTLSYQIHAADGSLVCQAQSEHCFLNNAQKLIHVKRELPLFYQALTDALT